MTDDQSNTKHVKSNNLKFDSDEYFHLIGVLDQMGGSFKDYLLLNNMPERIRNLKKGLDQKSIDVIDKLLHRILHFPDASKSKYFQIKRKDLWDKFGIAQEKQDTLSYYSSIDGTNGYKAHFDIGLESYNPDTFFYHHGLSDVSDKIKAYIKNKDFIDAGAYIGDSVLILNQYTPKRVHSFEISKITCDRFIQVMKDNHVPSKLYKLNQKGISDKHKHIYFNDTGTQGTNVMSQGDDKAELIPLDPYVDENKLDVGFIKSDVEGDGLAALEGMSSTIRKYRPVLSLSIYHNPQEFFELKPCLENIVHDLNYQIEIKHLHPVPSFLAEVVVFAYPNELA